MRRRGLEYRNLVWDMEVAGDKIELNALLAQEALLVLFLIWGY